MKRALWILAVLLSHWRKHPMQFVTLLVGLVAATALWSGVQALNQQARASYDRAAAIFGGARTAVLIDPAHATFPQQIFVDLRRAGWPVSPMLEDRVQIGGRAFRLLGIEPVTLPPETATVATVGKNDLPAFIAPPGQTLVAPETLADLGVGEGAAPTTGDGVALPPLKLQPQLAPGVLVMDIGMAQRVLNKPGQVSRLLVGRQSQGMRAPLASIVGNRLQLIAPDAESDLARLTDSFHLNLTAFGLQGDQNVAPPQSRKMELGAVASRIIFGRAPSRVQVLAQLFRQAIKRREIGRDRPTQLFPAQCRDKRRLLHPIALGGQIAQNVEPGSAKIAARHEI